MRASLLPLPLFMPLIVAAPILAQGSVPGFSLTPKPNFIIVNSFTSAPGKDIRSVQQLRLTGNRPGAWTTALTTGALESYFGGDGKSSGVVLGVFDSVIGAFTVNLEAKALNSTANESDLYLDASGTWAIFRRGTAIMLASRAKPGTAFGKPVAVTGFGTLKNPSPSLARVGKQNLCFYSDGKAILAAPIDLGKATVDLSKSKIISYGVQTGARPFAPTPLLGADGDCEGILFSEEVSASDSDLVWAADLDPATKALVFMQTADYTNNASTAGGYVMWGHRNLPKLPWHLMHSEVSWLLGDVESPGGLVDLTLAAITPKPSQVSSFVFGSVRLWPAMPVPGIGGMLGIDPTVMVLLGFATHPDHSGMTQLSFKVPNRLSLKGVRVQIQAIAVNSARRSLTFSNTSRIQIQ